MQLINPNDPCKKWSQTVKSYSILSEKFFFYHIANEPDGGQNAAILGSKSTILGFTVTCNTVPLTEFDLLKMSCFS